MLSLVINKLKTFIPKELPKRLGRWNIDYCNKKIDQKIDLSNEDHCGPCGQYIISKSTKTLNDKIIESVKN
jgi:hypothetical protein